MAKRSKRTQIKPNSAAKARPRVKSANRRASFQQLIIGKRFMVAVFVLGFAFIGVTTLLLTRAANPSGPIKGIASKCLDNYARKQQRGNRIVLWQCNNSPAQDWTLPGDGTIRLRANTKYCLDVKYRGVASKTPVWLWPCNGTVAQQWKILGDGSIVYNNPEAGSLCLDDQWAGTTNGNPIWVYTCNGTAAQKWSVPTVEPSGGNVPTPPPPQTGGGSGSGVQPTGNGIALIQNLPGATLTKQLNAAGKGTLVSLQPKTYTFSDFKDGQQTIGHQKSAYGAWVTAARGILGAGSKYTTIQMNPHTSKKAGDVPPNCGGGTGCPTNNLYLLRLDAPNAKVDGVTVRGTSQGHLYNGLRFDRVLNPVLSNSTIAAIPGNSSANPGETFAVNLQRTSGTAIVSNVTIDGANIGAGGLAANTSSSAINVDGLYTANLRYSAGVALWQQTGTVNLRNFSSINNARALGVERLGATVNLYDPNWSTPRVGHDITYTPYSGHKSRINFYFSSASKVPKRKIVILTNTKSVTSTVHVYIDGMEKSPNSYISWQGI